MGSRFVQPSILVVATGIGRADGVPTDGEPWHAQQRDTDAREEVGARSPLRAQDLQWTAAPRELLGASKEEEVRRGGARLALERRPVN
jgi:hypothetical protein